MNSLVKKFDLSYLILIPGVFLTYFVPIRFRFGPIIIIPFIALWLIMTLLKNQSCSYSLSRAFLGFFVPLLFFFVIRGYLFGYNEWDDISMLRHYRTYGIVLFYSYLLHYSLSRRKVRELRVLIPFVLFSLAYGCFAYLSFESGSARNQMKGIGGESLEQTYTRLERAFAGVSNYGDTYGMVMISICLFTLMRYVPKKWKVLYGCLILVYCLGVFRASYTTATVLLLIGMVIALIYNLLKFRIGSIHRFMIPFSVFFIVSVAFPQIYSPFSGFFHVLSQIIPSEEYALRIQSIADSMQGYKDTYAVQRAELYWHSIDVFIHNPVWGFRFDQILFERNMELYTRGHSFVFDSFACGGLFLGGLLVVGVVNFFKYLKLAYRNLGISIEVLSGFKIAIWILVIIACINQIAASFETMIVLVFVLPCLPLFNYEYLVLSNPLNNRMPPIGYGHAAF